MRTILLTISYDGTDFCGWQKQKETITGKVRTVQEELEKALEIIHKVFKPLLSFLQLIQFL